MLGLHLLDFATLAIYLIGIMVAGLWVARKIKNTGDYFMGGRSFGKAFMIMHAFGTGTHTDQAVTVAGASYKLGMAGIWYQWLYLFATPFYWLIAPIWRRLRYLTIADFFEDRFSNSLGYFYALYGLLYFAIQIGIMLLGTGKTASAMTGGAISPEIAIGVMTVLFLSYGLLGGLPAAIITDFIQGIFIIVLSFLLVPFVIDGVGGFTGLHQQVPIEKFSLEAPGDPPPGYDRITPFFIVMVVINALVGIIAQPHHMEIGGAGKTEREARVGFTYGNMIKRLCTVAWAFTGVACIALYPSIDDPEHAFGLASRDLLPIGLVGIMLASMIAAVMSTCDSFMVDGAALFVENFYKPLFKPEADDKHYLTTGRIVALILVVFGIIIALYFTSVVAIIRLSWSLVAFFGIAFWGGILWRRCNAPGAWAGLIVSAFLFAISGQTIINLESLGIYIGGLGWELPYRYVLYIAGGFAALIIVSKLTKPQDKERLDRFYTLLHTPVGQEHKLREAGIKVVME